jgi:hypothetical protein
MCAHYVRLQLSRQHAPKPPSQLQGRDTSRLAASWQQASQPRHWQAAQPGQCALLTRRDPTTSIASCPLARSQGTAAAEAASHGEGRYQSPALADWPQWAGKSTGWSPFGVAASMRKLRVPASRAPSCQLGAMPRVGPRQAAVGASPRQPGSAGFDTKAAEAAGSLCGWSGQVRDSADVRGPAAFKFNFKVLKLRGGWQTPA